MKLNLTNCSGFKSHRSGWGYCIDSLRPYHSNSGIYVDDFIERSFSWELREYYLGQNKFKIPYKFDWVGFIHNPPNAPTWFDNYNNPQSIIKRNIFIESLKYCRCLISLSEYLLNWLKDNLPIQVPIISVKHPTEIPARTWNFNYFLNSPKKQVIQIGYWLRNFDSICHLKVPNQYYKSWMPSNQALYQTIMKNFEANQEQSYAEVKNKWANTSIHGTLSNEEYDSVLSCSVAFCNLYDSSANNAVVECIARNTPLLINRLPAVVEYLGPEYPFYFEKIDECFDKLADYGQIRACHEYLKGMNKDWIYGSYFANDLIMKLKEIQ